MAEPPSNADDTLELAYASFAIFANDGTLDLDELNFLLGIALKDGTINDDERDILAGVLDRIREPDVSADVWRKHGL